MSATGRAYIVTDANGIVVNTDWRVNDLTIPGATNAIGWKVGTPPFTVYARDDSAAVFGHIGDTQERSFIDAALEPDFAAIWTGTGSPSPALTQSGKSPTRLSEG